MGIEIFIEYIREGIKEPFYRNNGDAGMDICAAEDRTIYPGQTVIIPAGIRLAIPNGYEVQIRARSGISAKTPLRLSNCVGTIDSGYRGEIGVIMTNTSKEYHKYGDFYYIDGEQGYGTYKIRKGDRIAQMILCRYEKILLKETTDAAAIGEDRGGGFGSTGV